jgi:hypothetical protein
MGDRTAGTEMDIDELTREVVALMASGRHATPLRRILDALKDSPRNQRLLELAAITLYSGVSRGQMAGDLPGETLTLELRNDPRLDAVFSECVRCGRDWVTNPVQYGLQYAKNPSGAWCGTCQQAYCERCFARTGHDVDAASVRCPDCAGPFTQLKAPTGRKPRQVRPRPEALRAVIVFREGMIAPDGEYLEALMRAVCPDVFRAPEVRIRTAECEDMAGVRDLALAYAIEMDSRYASCGFERETIDTAFEGDRVHLLRVLEAPPGGEDPLELPHIGALVDDVAATKCVRSRSGPEREWWTRVGVEPIRGASVQAIHAAAMKARHDGKPFTDLQELDDVTIVVSAFLPARTEPPSRWFALEYGKVIERLIGMLRDPAHTNVVHWIYAPAAVASDELHASCLLGPTGCASLAPKLLTDQEKQVFGVEET